MIPSGKKESLPIPQWIKENKTYLTFFIRGLFDTDGCVVLQKFGKYSYVLVKISMKDSNFAKDINWALIS